jgi:hypothetical protein
MQQQPFFQFSDLLKTKIQGLELSLCPFEDLDNIFQNWVHRKEFQTK